MRDISVRPADPRCSAHFDGEIAIGLGAFDVAPTDLMPTYELWVARREKWFRVAMPTQQFPGDRT